MSHRSTLRLVNQLGQHHDKAVKEWRDSFLLDLDSLTVPAYEEKGEGYDVLSDSEHGSEISSDEDNTSDFSDCCFDDDVNEESYLPSTDDDDIDITRSNKLVPDRPLIVHHPEVLEPSYIVKVLPGVPLQVRHKGFRLCGDNIDKSIRRRHLRSDRRNQSLHYFHTYAMENRVDISHLSDVNVHISELTSIQYIPNSVLPRLGDDTQIRQNISALVSRVLCKHLDFFKLSFDGVIEWHIQHKYYTQMSCKSEVVCIYFNYRNKYWITHNSSCRFP